MSDKLLSAIVFFIFSLPVLMLLWTALICYRAWRYAGNRETMRRVGVAVLAMILCDGLAFSALPRLDLSFGPANFLWGVMVIVRVEMALGIAIVWRRVLRAKLARVVIPIWVLNLALLAGEVYGMYIEPFNLGVTQVSLSLPASIDPAPIHIVQLADLHVERTTKRERAMLAMVEQLKPDLILMTGDYLNLSYIGDATARRDARDILSQLHAPYGVYAVRGTVDNDDDVQALFGGLDNITMLQDQMAQLDIAGQKIYLVGVSDLEPERDRASLRALISRLPPGAFSILMYHNPDLIETASELGVNIYLAGHTHGGQVRLPWYGAIMTSSRYGKRYEAGLYQVGPTRLYVSRGIGMEGMIMPRVRFLCPPEIVELSLTSQGGQ